MSVKKNKLSDFSNNYDLSISDLMSALCCIFLLFLAITVLQLNTAKAEYAAKNELADKYIDMQYSLYQNLNEEFYEELKKWNVEITPDLTFHFSNADVLFNKDSAELTKGFKQLLDDFFPKMIAIISQEKFRDEILEIRIEGHTAIVARVDPALDYRTGMRLSQDRTTAVLLYCLQETELENEFVGEQETIKWVRERIAAIGYSNSIPVLDEKGNPDLNKSRRVEIKIKTKAENVITNMQGLKLN